MFSAKQIRLYHKENDAKTKFNVLGMHYIPRVMIIQKQSFDKELHNWPTRQHPTKKSIRVDIRRIIQLIQKFSPPRGISLARLCSWPRRALVLPPAHGTTQGAGPGARDVVGFSMGFTRPGKRSQKTMEHPPIVHGKIHYFYGHFQ